MKPISPDQLPRYSKSDYMRWEGDWELIKGIPFSMSPSLKSTHQGISSLLANQIGNLLRENSCDCFVFTGLDLHLSETNIVRPDVMIVCGSLTDDYPNKASLVIEVLSESTRLKDLNLKYKLYEEHRIPYYILVDPTEQMVKAFRYSEDGFAEMDFESAILLDNCTINIIGQKYGHSLTGSFLNNWVAKLLSASVN